MGRFLKVLSIFYLVLNISVFALGQDDLLPLVRTLNATEEKSVSLEKWGESEGERSAVLLNDPYIPAKPEAELREECFGLNISLINFKNNFRPSKAVKETSVRRDAKDTGVPFKPFPTIANYLTLKLISTHLKIPAEGSDSEDK